jgi:Fe-S-cluster containining protein
MKINIPTDIRFQCQGSGKCCVSHGEYGHVFLSPVDRKNLAKSLNLSTVEFTKQYCHKVDGYWAIKDNPNSKDCLFLEKKKCTVYDGRPTQCRTWPFWPDVMSAKAWANDVVAFCPGIGKGDLISPESIKSQLEEQVKNERLMFNEASKNSK